MRAFNMLFWLLMSLFSAAVTAVDMFNVTDNF